jgi:Tol biopolymer transport system component
MGILKSDKSCISKFQRTPNVCVFRKQPTKEGKERFEVNLKTSFFVAVVGAAIVAIVSILFAIPPSMMAGPHYSDWSEPVNLGAVVNSSVLDAGPALSKDGKSLYFYSTRQAVSGFDLFVSRWSEDEEDWGAPKNLGEVVNSTSVELTPSLSRDGHWLFFASNRPLGRGGRDIWISYRQHVHDDFAWQAPVNAGPGINTAADEADPSFVENEDAGTPELFFARGDDIYVSRMLADGSFGPAVPVSEMNTTFQERGISVRFDGLEAFFYGNRSGNADLWTMTRQNALDPWSGAANLGSLVNSSVADGEPEISPDRETLYFNSNRTGGSGAMDLYKVTRVKAKKEK